MPEFSRWVYSSYPTERQNPHLSVAFQRKTNDLQAAYEMKKNVNNVSMPPEEIFSQMTEPDDSSRQADPESTSLPSAYSTSSSLLERLRIDDSEAWSRFAKLYTPLVYQWIEKAGFQSADVADVTQEVFRVVSTRLHVFRRTDSRTSFRSWLWGITRNMLRQHLERVAKRPAVQGGSEFKIWLDQIPEYLESKEPPEQPDEERKLMHRALAMIQSEFSEQTWQAFWRMTVENQSAQAIGEDLGMSPRAVRQAKYRVLCRLRNELID
ncbi:RNA polymerase sigma factor [Stieleria varia]|uniref:RNA polymerase sigma factor RpoE n=1 Tax=Stieleria varia TaxID=2528005 RepID=A0A5C6A4C8_9BACT|nr:sigma-70 family RNA polymerase sigma factor [Stieleria varia]TWT93961.1 RNA polymerase sigma factor RpoE [Stieleria varia]